MNKSFIMNKSLGKLILVIILCAGIFSLVGCANSDAMKFKDEYEGLNGKTSSYGSKYRDVSIDKDNPFVYASTSDIVKMMDDNETFFVYFGDKQCPWCRSAIEKAIEVSKKYNVGTIYYVNIWDDEHNELLRDKYELDDENKPKMVSAGTKEYKKLLKYFDNVLADYTLTDDEGNEVSVGEKRIFAPNFIYVKEGKAIKLVEGTSDVQKDANAKLTDEMLKDEEKQFKTLFSLSKSCDKEC